MDAIRRMLQIMMDKKYKYFSAVCTASFRITVELCILFVLVLVGFFICSFGFFLFGGKLFIHHVVVVVVVVLNLIVLVLIVIVLR